MEVGAGTRLGRYEIIAPLGEGGMGKVFKAKDTRLDRIVAIKVSREQFTARFEREARAVAALNHPNICQIYDVGPNYLVMEYVEGQRLSGPMPPDRVVECAIQMCDALKAAHEKGIVHRDLKPANILLSPAGIKLLDFGLAKIGIAEGEIDSPAGPTETVLTKEHSLMGTLQYMAPEQLEGKTADTRSDIFALGATLYELATGRKAFEGASTASVIAAIMDRDPPSVAGVSGEALEAVVRRCLAKAPEDRWQSARELSVELKKIGQGGTPAQPRTRRRPLKWAAAAAVWAMGPRSAQNRKAHGVHALPDVMYAHRGLHDAGSGLVPAYAAQIADLKKQGGKLITTFGIGRVCHIAFWEPHFAGEFASEADWKKQTHRLGAEHANREIGVELATLVAVAKVGERQCVGIEVELL